MATPPELRGPLPQIEIKNIKGWVADDCDLSLACRTMERKDLSMKLLDSTMAPNPRRVRIFLAEKGIEVPVEQVDIGASENRTAEFAAKNP